MGNTLKLNLLPLELQAGAIDETRVALETLGSIKRAGADLIFSYFALQLAEDKAL